MASVGSFHFRILVGMKRIPLHARSLALAQHILGTACAQLELAPPEVIPNDDDRELFVAAWCLDPIFFFSKDPLPAFIEIKLEQLQLASGTRRAIRFSAGHESSQSRMIMIFACNKGTVGPQSLMCRPSYVGPISCSCR
jgi:hypothetical protein